jgi:hypothetical protein
MESRFGYDFSRVPVFTTQPQSRSRELVVGAAHNQYEREADANASHVVATTETRGRRADFSDVRIHTDSRAAKSADAVNARAYTVGNHIVFGSSRYAPQATEGKVLLAHELTHVLQQTPSTVGVLQRSPDEGKKEKGEENPATKFPGCDKDQQSKITDAIKQADALASRAVRAFEREYILPSESSARDAHFGKKLGTDQKATILDRYKHVHTNLENKMYSCDRKGKKVKEGKGVVDVCAQAECPGNKITLFPDFGKETCPAGPVLLHEAIHNAGGCDDVNKGESYPPSSSEDNAYSYEYFALEVATESKTPELGTHTPSKPKVKD